MESIEQVADRATEHLWEGFAKAPFHLDAASREWVAQTFEKLDDRAKAALVFCVFTFGPQVDLARLKGLQPGFITRMAGGSAAQERAQLARLNGEFAVPVMFSTDLEGSSTTPIEATPSPVPLAFSAANDPALTQAAAAAMAREARAHGLGWSFTPALDLNVAFRSSITGTRSYGSDLEKVRDHALATLKGLQSEGIGATAKHWPGEGYDPRDQHLVTTVNPLSFAQWEASFGTLYRAAIDAGVLAIMPAHIALPSYMREVEGVEGAAAFVPASLNAALNENLLRGRLGFNGLLISDATAMAGISGILPRDALVIDALNAGNDVILDAPDLARDVDTILAALADGRLPRARLDAAVARQLAFKAALGAHRDSTPEPRDPAADRATILSVLERAPTLVKTRDDLLPMTPARYKKICLVTRGKGFPPASTTRPLPLGLADLLRARGFEVVEHAWGTPVDPEGCDLLLYAYAEECLLTRGTITNDWGGMTGQFEQAMKRFWNDLPCVMVSFGWPYHLFEANRVHTYVNAYMAHPKMLEITLEALMGQRAFEGVSPVDAFCGLDPAYFES
ncbi:Beta-N-acetylglucosaminidase/beta-glucosidase [Aquimixticola soesokkakensis]|uniref:Beta-N-acetylglucosaminidase/beta-glucosidase n=1 Tax=Aquimixticola soesokkakensis TaxID=1519096 RepID=A0A1Y5TH18_9RHOB|nr:glycoside hydrolase family 3 N-terminal domain-containing protein [Aquimixticola soesokkakensis]SLN60219.1 Beta-N-acetylglucosaminidase/beta-glucosidase [Aquimixticola soesokkakensis]